MKKRIHKWIVSGLLSGLILVSMQGSIYAQTNNEINNEISNKILTLDQVITSAMKREDKVNVLEKKIDAYKESLNETFDVSGMSYYSAKYSHDQAVQEMDLLEDTVVYNMTELYQNICLLKKQLKFNALEIELAEKELQVAKIKRTNGQISDLDLQQAQYNVENKKSLKKQNELTLEDYISQLYTSSGINVNDYEGLEEATNYELLEAKQSIEVTISQNVDYYMKNTEAYVAYQQDNEVEVLESKYSTSGVTLGMWRNNKAELAQTSYNTEKQREKMVESLRTSAAELKKLEERISLQEEQIKNSKKELEALVVRYNNGYISELDKKKAEENLQKLELSKLQNIYTYTQLKMVFEKPWVKY